MSDGVNTCAYSEYVYRENYFLSTQEIDQLLMDYCGCERIIVTPIDVYEFFFHIDLAAKFVSQNKILIAETSPHIDFYDLLEEIASIYYDSVDHNGNPYEIIRVPIKGYPLGGGVYYPKTYLNSLIINNKYA